jgi:hypothetical protein
MERRREREGDAGAGKRRGHGLGREREVDPERGEYVRRPRGRARRPVAVLDDGDTGCRGHERRHRRHVHRAEPVAAGADDVEHRRVDAQRESGLEDGVAEADDLVDRFALGPQCDQESAQLRRRRGTGHDLPHRPRGLRDAQIASVQKCREDARPGVQLRHSAEA